MADRETRGVVKSSRRDLFEKAWIQALADRDPYVFVYKPNVVYLAIDPAGGGSMSDFAVCSLAYENTHHVVIVYFIFYIFVYAEQMIITTIWGLRVGTSGLVNCSPLGVRPCSKCNS